MTWTYNGNPPLHVTNVAEFTAGEVVQAGDIVSRDGTEFVVIGLQDDGHADIVPLTGAAECTTWQYPEDTQLAPDAEPYVYRREVDHLLPPADMWPTGPPIRTQPYYPPVEEPTSGGIQFPDLIPDQLQAQTQFYQTLLERYTIRNGTEPDATVTVRLFQLAALVYSTAFQQLQDCWSELNISDHLPFADLLQPLQPSSTDGETIRRKPRRIVVRDRDNSE